MPAELPRVRIVSPALAADNNGNSHTAGRWRRFLAPIATVNIAAARDGDDATTADLLIALHARRSADAIARLHEHAPQVPIVVVLTGTDLYRDLETDASARHSVECASAIVVLQAEGLARLEGALRGKARVIVQSAPALVASHRPDDADFVAVGHLRDEKDPETLMNAARLLADDAEPASIVHIGAALDARLGDLARATLAACPRYRWLGPLAHGAARRAIAGASALVHTSRLEGGANVVIEAVRSRVPVLASRIDGNVGLLGRDYDGYFAVGDAVALAALMRRFLAEPAFAQRLAAQCAAREPLFLESAERRAVRALVTDLVPARRDRH